MGKIIVMGKTTFNSLPKLLPGRKHVILSDDDDFNKDLGNSVVFHTKEDLMDYLNIDLKEQEVFITGGASMYSMFVDICDGMYLTMIGAEDKDADVYFPEFNKENWEMSIEKTYESNGIQIVHTKFVRKR